MKHPAPEQWMGWLYHELPAEQHHELDAHLAMCVECREQVGVWRQTMGALDEWQVPVKAKSRPVMPMMLRWAAAAVVVLGIGIGIGRLTAPTVDVAEIQAGLRKELAVQLAEIQKASEAARLQDQATLAAALEEMDDEHAAVYKRLREDLETVALAAENRLYATERQIVQLVSFTKPANEQSTTER